MGVKTFLLGAAVAYGIQHITKKRVDGSSILSDFVDNPPDAVTKAQNYAAEAVDKIAQKINPTVAYEDKGPVM